MGSVLNNVKFGNDKKPIAYGIDFGTSNSCVSVAYKNKVEGLGKLTSPGIPSLLYLDKNNQELVGDEAAEQFLLMGGFPRCRVMSSLKLFLADSSFTHTSSWDKEWDLSDLVACILRYLKREADEFTGHDVRNVVLGYPIIFPGVESSENFSEQQELAMERLRIAAERAGFNEIEFLDEPTAALTNQDIAKGIAIALDFGGGTFDSAVIDFSSRRNTSVLATNGIDIGGQQFDKVVFDKTLSQNLGLRDLPHYAQSLKYIGDMGETLMMGASPNILQTIARLIQNHPQGNLGPYGRLKRILTHGHAYSLMKVVEETKIRLSQDTTVDLLFDRSSDGLRLSNNINRTDFEDGISSKINEISDIIDETIQDAGIDSSRINEVILTGGSCQIPLFRKIVDKKFPTSLIRETDYFGRVCSGLALHGQRIWS